MDDRMSVVTGALRAGDRAKVERMLDEDPTLVRVRDENGLDLVILAKYYREDDIADVLIQRGAEVDIFSAAALGKIERLGELLKGRADLREAYSADGWTPLHLAAHFGQTEAARLLIDSGADLEARSRNRQRNMPLHAALPYKNLETIRLLIERGANVNARLDGGLTPLHEAAIIGDRGVAEILLAAGADRTARTDEGKRPIDLAREHEQRAVVELLEEVASP